MPLTIPPIACSRTPNRRLRPACPASKWSWPLALTSVRLDSDRSADPPNSSGSDAARTWIASWLTLRVAASVPVVEGREARVPAVGQPAGDPAPELRCLGRVRLGVGGERGLPAGDQLLALGDARAEQLARLVRDVERLVRVPAVRLLGEANLVRAERRAVRLLRPVLVRGAVADDGTDRDDRRPLVGLGGRDGRVDRLDVVAVVDALDVPAIRGEPLEDVLGERPGRRAVELDPVVVVERDELAQPEVAGERARLRADALLEVAVGADDVRVVVDELVARRG